MNSKRFCLLKNRNPDVCRETFESFYAHERISVFVQFGAPHGDTEFTRNDGNDSATDTAFPRHPDAEGKFSRFIVESAGKHQGTEAFGTTHGEDVLVVMRVRAVVGKEQERFCQILAGHGDAALVTIDVDQGIHVVLDVAETFHEMSQGLVAAGMFHFGLGDEFVKIDIIVTGATPRTNCRMASFGRW